MRTRKFRATDNVTVLKWLRAHGERGRDWDFTGGLKGIEIEFRNDTLETMYIMEWEWSKPDTSARKR